MQKSGVVRGVVANQQSPALRVLLLVAGVVGASATLEGCQGKQGGAAIERAVLALNVSPQTSDFVLEAQNSIRLQTGGVVIVGGDLGARGTGSGPF